MKDYIERYLYQISKYLPRKQRDDIVKELESTLYDMTSEMTSDQEVMAALKDFGSPRTVAARFAPEQQYLVGPQLYPIYEFVLTITLLAVTIGVFVATSISLFVEEATIMGTLFGFFTSLISAGLSTFASVTITFALIQRFLKDDIEEELEKDFQPEKLPKVPSPANRISLVKVMVSILFSILFALLLVVYPDRIGAFFFEGDQVIHIQLLNLDTLRYFIPFFLLGIAGNILHAIFLISKRQWTRKLRLSRIGLEVYNALIIILFFTNDQLIDPGFESGLNTYMPNFSQQFALNQKVSVGLLIAVIIFATGKEIYDQLRNL